MAKKKAGSIRIDRNAIQKQMIMRLNNTEMVLTASIHPNSFNRNVMSAETFESLKRNIANPAIGFSVPVLARPHPEIPDELEIVDGFHRWKAACELGLEKIPVINLDNMPEAVAKYMMIATNNIHGYTTSSAKEEVLKEVMSDAEWEKIMGDVNAFEMANVPIPEVEVDLKNSDYNPSPDDIVKVSIDMTKDQRDIFRRIVGQMRLATGMTKSEAVIECLTHYAAQTGFGGPTGDAQLDQKQADLLNDEDSEVLKVSNAPNGKQAIQKRGRTRKS